jgi:hypothetical protein
MVPMESLRTRQRLTIVAVVFLVIAVSWSGFVDRKTEEYVDKAMVQALAAFATARVLNATITVAKSVQIENSVGIAAVSLQPLELLDPVHDLVEQYSSIMKLAIGSLVTQKLLIGIVSAQFFKLLLTAVGVLLIASLFIQNAQYSTVLLKLFALAALVRFLFVLTLATNALVDQAYVKEKTEENMAAVQVTASEIRVPETTSELSIKERDSLFGLLDQLEKESSVLIDQREPLRLAASRAQEEVHEAQAALQEVEAPLSLFDRNNPFTKNPELLAARSILNEKKKAFAANQDELYTVESKLEAVARRVSETNATLNGESKQNWLAGMSAKLKSLVDTERFEGLGERIQNIVPNILNLMALFVFKTLIMPVIFLFLFLRGFRYIWGTSVRELVNREIETVRAEFRS